MHFIIILLIIFNCSFLYANPEGGIVSGGQADLVVNGKNLEVVQHSDKAIIDWQRFDIAAGEYTQFKQPSTDSIALNRVNSYDSSKIDGNLTANGKLIIINQNGIIFAKNAKVDVNGLLATTSNIDNKKFMQQASVAKVAEFHCYFDKPGKKDGTIVNEGTITTESGLVGLVAPNVINTGVIRAKAGKVALGSGDLFTIDLYGDDLIALEASGEIKSQLVGNDGEIIADGGQILLTAAAGKELVNSLIMNSGELKARSRIGKKGEIIISGQGSNAVKDNIANNKGKKAGNSKVVISGLLDVSGMQAGESGGKLQITGDEILLASDTIINASGHSGTSGTSKGKEIWMSRLGSAGGEILIGGDYLGKGNVPTAKELYVDFGVLILNDAIDNGDAGRSIFWSDGSTRFYGRIYSRALGGLGWDLESNSSILGGNAGDGGFVETSGKQYLDVGGDVNLTASSGSRGNFLLDPSIIKVYGGQIDPSYTSTDGNLKLSESLMTWLDFSDSNKILLKYQNKTTTSAASVIGASSIAVNTVSGLFAGAKIKLGDLTSTNFLAKFVDTNIYTIVSIDQVQKTLSINPTLNANYPMSTTVSQGHITKVYDKAKATKGINYATITNAIMTEPVIDLQTINLTYTQATYTAAVTGVSTPIEVTTGAVGANTITVNGINDDFAIGTKIRILPATPAPANNIYPITVNDRNLNIYTIDAISGTSITLNDTLVTTYNAASANNFVYIGCLQTIPAVISNKLSNISLNFTEVQNASPVGTSGENTITLSSVTTNLKVGTVIFLDSQAPASNISASNVHTAFTSNADSNFYIVESIVDKTITLNTHLKTTYSAESSSKLFQGFIVKRNGSSNFGNPAVIIFNDAVQNVDNNMPVWLSKDGANNFGNALFISSDLRTMNLPVTAMQTTRMSYITTFKNRSRATGATLLSNAGFWSMAGYSSGTPADNNLSMIYNLDGDPSYRIQDNGSTKINKINYSNSNDSYIRTGLYISGTGVNGAKSSVNGSIPTYTAPTPSTGFIDNNPISSYDLYKRSSYLLSNRIGCCHGTSTDTVAANNCIDGNIIEILQYSSELSGTTDLDKQRILLEEYGVEKFNTSISPAIATALEYVNNDVSNLTVGYLQKIYNSADLTLKADSIELDFKGQSLSLPIANATCNSNINIQAKTELKVTSSATINSNRDLATNTTKGNISIAVTTPSAETDLTKLNLNALGKGRITISVDSGSVILGTMTAGSILVKALGNDSNITIPVNNNITVSGETNPLILVAGNRLINNNITTPVTLPSPPASGTNPAVASSTRWIVFSKTPKNNVGVNSLVGRETAKSFYNQAYFDTALDLAKFANFSTVNLLIYSANLTELTLSPVVANSKTLVYGDTLNIPRDLTVQVAPPSGSTTTVNITYTVTGYSLGEQTDPITGAPILTTTYQSSSLPGNYPISFSINTLESSLANYTVGYYTNRMLESGIVVNKKPLQVSIPNVPISISKVYDKTTTANIANNIYSSAVITAGQLLGSDTATLDSTACGANYANANVGSNQTVTITGFRLSSPDAISKYTVSDLNIPNVGTITPVSLQIIADNKIVFYGDPEPVFSYRVIGLLSGDLPQDILTGKLSRDPGSMIAKYKINQNTLSVATNNYRITSYQPGVYEILAMNEQVINAYVESVRSFTPNIVSLGDNPIAIVEQGKKLSNIGIIGSLGYANNTYNKVNIFIQQSKFDNDLNVNLYGNSDLLSLKIQKEFRSDLILNMGKNAPKVGSSVLTAFAADNFMNSLNVLLNFGGFNTKKIAIENEDL